MDSHRDSATTGDMCLPLIPIVLVTGIRGIDKDKGMCPHLIPIVLVTGII